MDDIIETHGRYRLRLATDPHPESSNPRTEQDCNLANVITLRGQRYIDVDKDGGPLEYGLDYFQLLNDGADLFIRWARIFHGAVAVENRPHDGANAIWYLMPEKLADTTVPEGKTAEDWAREIIESEIQEYDRWRNGEVYGYKIEKQVDWLRKLDQDVSDIEDLADELSTWEPVEDCWGYIGREYAEESAREAFEPYKED